MPKLFNVFPYFSLLHKSDQLETNAKLSGQTSLVATGRTEVAYFLNTKIGKLCKANVCSSARVEPSLFFAVAHVLLGSSKKQVAWSNACGVVTFMANEHSGRNASVCPFVSEPIGVNGNTRIFMWRIKGKSRPCPSVAFGSYPHPATGAGSDIGNCQFKGTLSRSRSGCKSIHVGLI